MYTVDLDPWRAAPRSTRSARRPAGPDDPAHNVDVTGLGRWDVFHLVGGVVAYQGETAIQLRLNTFHQTLAGDLKHVDAEAAKAVFRGIDQQEVAGLNTGHHRLPHRCIDQQAVRIDAQHLADPVPMERDELDGVRRRW